jgi:hypothetical protein
MRCGGTRILLDHKWVDFVMHYEVILSNMAKWLQLKGLLSSKINIVNIYTFNEFHKNENYRTN